ncbi:Large-conductance mechanosensitive channel [Bienertia sinuspersici]
MMSVWMMEDLVVGSNFEDTVASDVDTSDEECIVVRERVRGCKKQLIEVEERGGDVVVTEYDESDEEIHTPPESDEEETIEERRRKRSLLVGGDTDFEVFQWKVGQRFAKRDDVKNAVAKYGILQGRNVSFTISNKNRQQRMGDSRRAVFVVKRVNSEHTCLRTMTKKQVIDGKLGGRPNARGV